MNVFSLMALMLAAVCASVQAHSAESLSADTPIENNASASSASSSNIVTEEERNVVAEESPPTAADDRFRRDSWRGEWRQRRDTGNQRVTIGGNADLPAGETSDAVVAIAGDANVAGDVKDAVVAILGNTMVDGNVGESVVTVFGNSYVNSRVGENVVTIFGNVELGPQAVIEGELVTLGGTVKRDPAAVVNRVQSVNALPFSVDFGWFKTWVKECVFYGRLLAFHPDLMWAWGVALVSLLLYMLTAALVPHTVGKCVDTLETWPGRSLLAALLSIPLIPLLMLLLVITIVGILAIPIVGILLFAASWFGKLIMLGWIGKRLLQTFRMQQIHWALAVLIGGSVVTLLYTIPVVGLLSYKLLQFIGFGAVLYTLLLMFQKPVSHTTRSAATSPGTAAFGADSNAGNASHTTYDTIDTGATDAGASVVASAPESLTRAGFWPRMGALAIDVVLIGAVTAVLDLDDGLLLVLAAYGALMWKLKGTTIGGIVFHLQVVRSDGRDMDWSTSIVRALSCFLSLVALGLGFIWIAIDPEKQAWHDKIAGTVVVRAPKGKSLV